MTCYVRTAVNSEVPFPATRKQRGVRLWRGAEVSTSVWFLLEACVEQKADIEIRTFVTADIDYVCWLEKTMSQVRWSRLNLFMRFEQVTSQPLINRVLEKVYRSKRSGARVFHLDTGHVIAEPELPLLDEADTVKDLELVYCARGAEAELHCFP